MSKSPQAHIKERLKKDTSVGQLSAYYLDHQLSSRTPSEVGWISSIALFIVSAGSIFSGRYFDSHGTKLLAISGSLLSVIALVSIACEYGLLRGRMIPLLEYSYDMGCKAKGEY